MSKKKAHKVVRKTSPPIWIWVILGLVIIGIGATALLLGRPASSAGEDGEALPKEISVAQAAEKRTAGAFILDVREPSEWEEGHIPDATLIPLGQLESRLSEIPTDQEIVVVCRSGNRSATARDILLQAGFSQVTSMEGGINDWKGQGLPTIIGP